MSTDEKHQEAYRWIRPIMLLGNKVAGEALEDLADDDDKSVAAISAIRSAMNDEEQVIYFCESFSGQCNMSGMNNFFSDSIALYYYEVIGALEALGSEKMIQTLKRCKELIFGDQDVPVGDEESLDGFTDPDRPGWDEIEEQLEQIEEDSEDGKERFEDQLLQYAITCGKSGKLSKRID